MVNEGNINFLAAGANLFLGRVPVRLEFRAKQKNPKEKCLEDEGDHHFFLQLFLNFSPFASRLFTSVLYD